MFIQLCDRGYHIYSAIRERILCDTGYHIYSAIIRDLIHVYSALRQKIPYLFSHKTLNTMFIQFSDRGHHIYLAKRERIPYFFSSQTEDTMFI